MPEYKKTSRTDGRSDGQVIYDLAAEMKPNDILHFADLIEILQQGVTSITYDKNRAYSAVRSANKKLLKKNNRYLQVVRGTGYKMITSEEHLAVALSKKQSAQKNMQLGLQVLEHTVFDELTPAHRILHEQQMMIMRAIHQRVKFHDEKLSETDNIIDRMRNEQAAMMNRLEKLEGK